jgi:uncharacterized membrane protein (UPF0127 family)
MALFEFASWQGAGFKTSPAGDRPPVYRRYLLHSAMVATCLTLVGCPQAPPLMSAGGLDSPGSTPTVEAPASAPSAPEIAPDPSLSIPAGQVLPITAEVVLGDTLIGLEVASTPQEQALGLMYRPELPDNRGMVFPFTPPRPVSFWMRNVLIPLDMVFVHEGQIVGMAENVPPCAADPCPTYGPGRQLVSYVIELRGGRAAELGLAIGDGVEIQWLPTVEEEGAAATANDE